MRVILQAATKLLLAVAFLAGGCSVLGDGNVETGSGPTRVRGQVVLAHCC